MPRGLTRAVVAAALGVTCSGCALGHLNRLEFSRDNSLHIDSPVNRELVKVPLTIRWHTDAPAKEYGVFVDKAPIKVGETMASLGNTPAALAGHGAYLTTSPTLTLDVLPQVSDGHGDEQHEVTVVELDATGARKTESAWYVDFRFPRRQSTS